MKKLLLLLCLSVPAWAQIINGGGGGVTLNPPGVNTDMPCILGVNVLGACDSGNFKYSSSTLFAPNLSLSGNSTIAGSESVAGSLFVGAGTPNEGTTGTDLNGTAEFVNTAGVVQLKACATSKRYCFLVVKESSCGGGTGCTTGNAWVQGAFTETDTFSNTAVVGNWFKGSTTAAKQIEDTGTANTSACPSGVTCLGFAMTAGSGAQTVVRTAPVVGVTGAGITAGSFAMGSSGVQATNSTRFFPLTGLSSAQPSAVNAQQQFDKAMTLTGGHCSISPAMANSSTATISINISSTYGSSGSTGSTCTITDPGTTCTWATTDAVTAGQYLMIKNIISNTTATSTNLTCGVSYTIP